MSDRGISKRDREVLEACEEQNLFEYAVLVQAVYIGRTEPQREASVIAQELAACEAVTQAWFEEHN